jgi:flagellar hook-associated protein 3 FlgL
MRVTETTMANTSQTNLQRIQQRLQTLQEEVSSGVKVSSPGVDPLSAQQILDLQCQVNDGEQFTKNISTADSYLSIQESALSSMGDSLTRLKEIALQMSNSTYSAEQRQYAAAEVVQIRDQLIALGNTQSGGRYVFGGFNNSTPPFASDGTYSGGSDSINISIDHSNSVAINTPGDKVLGGVVGSSGTVDNLLTALNSGTEADVQNTLSGLDDASNQVLAARTDIGARMNRLDASKNFIDSTQVYLQKVISGKQDIDIAKAISDLTRQQTAYQAALMSTAKINQTSLLDYL